ncbi:PAN domain-containing protein [Penicillium chrysogenum]|nr:PAN domain-containing protein [Penicillium chrysogenum]
MKFRHLPALALLVLSGAAQSPELLEYRSLCSGGETEGTTTFDNGVTSDYTCRIKASGPINREETMNSAAECAAICGKGCAGVVWEYTKKNCVIYDSPATLSPHGRGSVYLKPTHVDENQEESVSECLDDKRVCEDELENQQDMLANCQSDQEDLKSKNQECEQENDELDNDLSVCRSELGLSNEDRETCQSERMECEANLSESQVVGEKCEADLALSQNESNSCAQDLTTCNSQRSQCQIDLSAAQSTSNENLKELSDCQSTGKKCQIDYSQCQTASNKCNQDLSACETGRNQCKQDLSSSESAHTQCKKDLSSSQSSHTQCQGSLTNCQTENSKLRKEIAALKANAIKAVCPQAHDKVVTVGNRRYQVNCQRYYHASSQSFASPSLEHCIQACNGDSTCRRATWHAGNRRCAKDNKHIALTLLTSQGGWVTASKL